MTFKTIIGLLLLFFVGRFLLRFILPIVKVTKAARKSMNDLKEQMQNMQQNQGYSEPQPNPTEQQHKKTTPKIDGEYIEFEEVK